MERFTLETSRRVWHPAFSTNTSTSVTTLSPIATQPTQNDGAVRCEGSNLGKLIFWGDKADNSSADGNQLHCKLYGWSANPARTLWTPSYIGKFLVTIGTKTGVALQYPDANDYFGDTIVLVNGDTSCRIITDTTNEIASVTVDLEGAEYLGVALDTGGLTGPATFNAAVGLF